MDRARVHIPGWRRDALRTNLWFVPSLLVVAAAALFGLTYGLDRAVHAHAFSLPSWVNTGGPDAARTLLTAIAAAVITVVGVVFSITILALQLASTQFGPRMLRNFIRDLGTQLTLGTFVATFVFSVLALGSVNSTGGATFVPHISVTAALVLLVVDLGVLIYFIHHVSQTIQLTDVVHAIARDFHHAIDELHADRGLAAASPPAGPAVGALAERLEREGVGIPAPSSGYLQAIGHHRLVQIAGDSDAIVQLAYRPGHFIIRGRPLAVVWPAASAPAVADGLARAHVTGSHRTLRQDPQFAIDQLVEIAIRALSPAVNDTFTALTCIDWLTDGLTRVSAQPLRDGVFRDRGGRVRLIEVTVPYDRLVNRAFDKIRQAGRGMPAVGIRQLDSLSRIADATIDDDQRAVVQRQADMILRAAYAAIEEANDRADVERAHAGVVAAVARRQHAPV
ncbi:MAG TPA: DUF2254 domain-containing protein [Acidimicrobiia bacterium]|nr:DUF2254 domain-containing protein [Acidimicrobiia bacterium]